MIDRQLKKEKHSQVGERYISTINKLLELKKLDRNWQFIIDVTKLISVMQYIHIE